MFDFFNRQKQENKVIYVNDMDELLGKVELIDIREASEYRYGSLKTAKNIPMMDLLKNPIEYMEKGKTYYLMCQSGSRSSMAAQVLSKMEFDVVNVAGGVGSYVGTNKQ